MLTLFIAAIGSLWAGITVALIFAAANARRQARALELTESQLKWAYPRHEQYNDSRNIRPSRSNGQKFYE